MCGLEADNNEKSNSNRWDFGRPIMPQRISACFFQHLRSINRMYFLTFHSNSSSSSSRCLARATSTVSRVRRDRRADRRILSWAAETERRLLSTMPLQQCLIIIQVWILESSILIVRKMVAFLSPLFKLLNNMYLVVVWKLLICRNNCPHNVYSIRQIV